MSQNYQELGLSQEAVLEKLLEVRDMGIRDDMQNTHLIFDESEMPSANEFLKQTLREKGCVTFAELTEHFGAHSVEYRNYRLACGMDFFVPSDIHTRYPVFDGTFVRLTGLEGRDTGVTYVDCVDDALVVKSPTWERFLDRWSPLIHFHQEPLEGVIANRGFSVIGNYRRQGYHSDRSGDYMPGEISCTLGRFMKLDTLNQQGIRINYEIKILENTPENKIHKISLFINDCLRNPGSIQYSLEVLWDEKLGKYIPSGRVGFYSAGTEIGIEADGSFSEVFRRGHEENDLDVLNKLYRYLGDPTKKVDFAATIQNAFDAVSANSMSSLVSAGYLVRR